MKESGFRMEQTSIRGFWSLFATQFQGAFSDNLLKNLVIFMLIAMNMKLADKYRTTELVGALFSLPFILFSMAGGFLADRFSKRTISVGVKGFEILVMSLALAGLLLGSMPILLGCVFLMGVHSAIFGPSKYGLLPELLPEKKLSWGNGLLELGTFTAVILGIATAGFMAERFRGHHGRSGAILIVLAAVGLMLSLGITKVPAADPQRKFQANFLESLFSQMRSWRGDRPLILAVLGNTYFTFLGALLLLNLFFFGANVLKVSEAQTGWLSAALAIGIGLGSVAAGYLSGGKIEYGLVPLGAVGLSIVCLSLAESGLSLRTALIRLALLGFAGGFFIVPISALLQHRPDKSKKGEVLAAANLLSFVGVFLASGAHYLLAEIAHQSPTQIFLFSSVLTLAGAVYVVVLLPDSLLRFVLWALTRTVYRIRIVGRDNIPAKGGALFVCNHVSFIDAMLLLASTDRQVRFMVFKDYYELPYFKPFARILGMIPISSEQRPREMIQSLKSASDAIRAGDVVCIFAEGEITRIGQLLPFRRGFERIMKDLDAPIIPIALDGVWGSIFSFNKGHFLWKIPRHLPYPVTVNYGAPLPSSATPFEVRQVVQELMAEAWQDRKRRMRPLHRALVRTARWHPFRFAMADAQNPKVRFSTVLTRAVFLARRLRHVWADQKMAGILLPPSVPGALVNYAAMLLGRVPVNLNYTLSDQALASCIGQCGITKVITSKAFLEKVKIRIPCDAIYLEEAVGKSAGCPPSVFEKLAAVVMAWLLPVGMLEHALGCESKSALDDLAAVVFSSGSTGDPKGVMLSHYNIGSNIEQVHQVFGFNRRDRMLGILPFFHSFGFMGTLWLPAALGIGVVYHPNPLDGKTIGPLVRDFNVTFLLATPTLLQIYMRSCTPEQFGGLRVVITGAEKLPDRLATAFEDRFGIHPMEGYGCTECAPCVATNKPDFRAAGYHQVGAKRGKIGHPLPGVSVRIVDPETMTPVPPGTPGLMLVLGPNVMQGYLGLPAKTSEVLVLNRPEGISSVASSENKWYVTGDIAMIDEDGFLQITDRLSRFSKIGGEMVSHGKVEETLHEAAGVAEQSFVVTGVKDEKKGEQLIVFHKLDEESLQSCIEKLAKSELPNLWKPRADRFVRVETFPYLGTGKLDLRRIREMAEQASTHGI
ncbi:MAG TPA: acyl-[ACP]--phospholipid O-acyltransferase [Acidobacteriota bacterium]|nr:acyl-[ACP]--phospholipid O-acyltransferase [Acidobacteriota bacterium]